MNIFNQRPTLFEKTACNIWTDPYIQHQMLAEHLNLASDGATRREESINKITNFILKNTTLQSRLLDLGCGPGLYTSLLKDKGYTVTGIDFNSASIDYAISQRQDIKYIFGDYIINYPAGTYDTVIMIYCDMGTHSDTDRNTLLSNIYNSLDDNGILLFDVFTDGIIADKHEGSNWEYSPSDGFWNKEEYLILSQTFHYPENKAFAYQYNLLTKDDSKHFIVWDRYYSENEIKEVLLNIGFKDVTIHTGVLDGNNFTSGSEMFVVAKK